MDRPSIFGDAVEPLTRTVSISSDVMLQELDGEAVLLDLRSERYFGLDESGTRFWQLLQEHSKLQTVYDAVLAEYDIEPSRLHDDLIEFVEQLAAAGLLTLD